MNSRSRRRWLVALCMAWTLRWFPTGEELTAWFNVNLSPWQQQQAKVFSPSTISTFGLLYPAEPAGE